MAYSDRILTCSEHRTVGAVGSSHHPVPRRSSQGSWMPRCSWHLIAVSEQWWQDFSRCLLVIVKLRHYLESIKSWPWLVSIILHTSNPPSNERDSSTYLPLSSCTSIKEDQIIEQYTVAISIISNINCYQSPIAKKLTPAFARDRALNKVAMVMAYW